MSDVLDIYYQNVRGLKTKTNRFRSELISSSYDVIILCETWLREDVFTSELFDDRYVVYRNDRDNAAINKSDGGGCLIAVKRNLLSKRVVGYELENDIWVSIEHVNGRKTYFNVKYIELGSSLDTYRKHFEKIVDNVMSSNVEDSFILCGDYNLGNSIAWSHDSLSGDCVATDMKGPIPNELLDTMSLCNLNQLSAIRNINNRTLDLFITNLPPNKVRIDRSSNPLVPEDGHHPAIRASADLSELKFLSEKRPPRVNFYKANYVRLNQELMRIDWSSELSHLDIDSAVEKFYCILGPFIDMIPKTLATSRDYPVYYSHQLISSIRRKDSIRLKIKRVNCPVIKAELRSEFCSLRKSVKEGIKVCFDNYILDCEEKIKSNTKCFFAFTKSLKKTNSLPNSMKYDGEEVSDGMSVSNLFAKYFSAVYTPAIDSSVEVVYDPFIHQSILFTELTDVSFTPAQVGKALKRFDKNKVSSPDDLPMMFFMQLSLSLSLPLSILFNKSMMENKFPSKWKTGYVSPIFKDGDRNDVTNYRPVTILCAMSKVFERLVFNKLFDNVKSNIHHSQHGFFQKRSTQTNLIEYVSYVADAIVAGGQVDTIYTDFAKAFDKVDHNTLMFKLKAFGLSDGLVQWFSTYLRDRSQFVIIGGAKSTRIIPTSGVPQGSILGPLLFIIFINDLLSSLSSCSGFADDLKLYKSIGSSYDCELLQGDIQKIVEWCKVNNMSLNVDKCAVMSTTHSRNKIIFPYTIDSEILKRVSRIKDLGIILDDKLSFTEHIDDITRKSYRMLGFIFRCGKYFTSQSSMRILYSSLVRNRLEYCSTVWNPLYNNAIDQIERVQKKFTRLFYFKFQIAYPRPSYNIRLNHLKLHSLETRRLENDEIMLYKLIHNHVDSSLSRQISFHQPSRITRHGTTFYLPKMVTNYQENAPVYRAQRNHDRYFRGLNVVGSNLYSYKKLVRNSFVW